VFEQELLEGVKWKSGCFAQDSVGDWWLCLPVEAAVSRTPAPKEDVGLDLGLRETVATSDGDKLEAGQFYRSIEQKIANAQRRGQQAGRCVQIVNERNTTRACSSCRALTGPSGLDMLDVRIWVCRECGVTHDRDVNAARNILFAGRCPLSIVGNESSLSAAPPSQTSRRCEAENSALKAVA
jgi:transposase